MTNKLNTLELEGWPLDFFTGKALGHEMLVSNGGGGPAYLAGHPRQAFEPSRRPDHLHQVLLRMTTVLRHTPGGKPETWQARAIGSERFAGDVELPVAVCRALVLHVFGNTVDAPEGVAPAADECEDLFA
jgi:hypothetical protein